LSSCSAGGSEAPDAKPAAPAQATAAEAADENTAESEAEQQSTAEAEAVPDSGLTLEKLKAKAQEHGYEVTPVEGYQLTDSIKPEDGFNLHYVDDNSDAFVPVFEFSSSDDALKYAGGVNSAGYNLCIVNGRFVTMTGAQYGIVT